VIVLEKVTNETLLPLTVVVFILKVRVVEQVPQLTHTKLRFGAKPVVHSLTHLLFCKYNPLHEVQLVGDYEQVLQF
jgi:hypothetical protein